MCSSGAVHNKKYYEKHNVSHGCVTGGYICTSLNGYYTKLPVITDTDCTSIARIWVVGFIYI